MNIKDKYRIDDVLHNLEMVLLIDGPDYEERNIDIVISEVKKRINRQYHIDLTNCKITDTQFDISNYQNEVAAYIDNAMAVHAKLCGLVAIDRYLQTSKLDLGTVNYLCSTEESFKTVLELLQVEEDSPRADASIESIKLKLGTIDNCREKRFLMVLVVAHAIGFNEIVAAVAELLWQSMI